MVVHPGVLGCPRARRFESEEADNCSKEGLDEGSLAALFHGSNGPKELGLVLSQDETGEEGIIVMPNDGRKKVLVGNRVSAEKIRQNEYESAEQMREAQVRNMERQQREVNDKAPVILLGYSTVVT